jgi:hypothetical protein
LRCEIDEDSPERSIITVGQVTVVVEEVSAAGGMYLQGSMKFLSRAGMHREAILCWNTVNEREMNPSSINSE